MPKPIIRITNNDIAGGPKPNKPDGDQNKGPLPDKEPSDGDPIRDQIISEIEKEKQDIIGDNEIPDYDKLDTEELKLLLDNLRKKKKQQEAKDKDGEKRSTIELPDGSVFEKIETKYKWYDVYYYVVYDLIHVPDLMNWWTCIDEYTISYTHHIYISGPTHSIADEVSTTKTNEWRYDFNSVPLNQITVFWDQGRHDIGDNSGGFVVPKQDIIPPTIPDHDPIDDQFESAFEEWQDNKLKPKVGTPIPSSSNSNHASGVKVGDKILSPDFFTRPHTLKELVELKLVDGNAISKGLLDNLTQAEVLFFIEYFPYSEK